MAMFRHLKRFPAGAEAPMTSWSPIMRPVGLAAESFILTTVTASGMFFGFQQVSSLLRETLR